jgi:hypothetical protein
MRKPDMKTNPGAGDPASPRHSAPESDDTVRCPRLGHSVEFAYCRRESGDLPCCKTIQCWQGRFDAAASLRRELTQGQWRRCFDTPPSPKILTLVELIEKARQGGGATSK